MLLKQGIVVAALLATAGLSWAGTGGLKPRVPIPKSPAALLRVPDDATGRLVIKFTDDVLARVEIDGSVHSLAQRSLDSANEIIDRFGLTVTPAINHPPEALAGLQRRAEDYSGKAQPDLAGMMHVTGPEDVLLTAARAFYQLDTIEFAAFETKRYLADETPINRPIGDRATGACCIPNDDETVFACTEDTPGNCLNAGGIYQGDNTVCGADGCKACCLDAETCEVMVEDNCLAQGGGFLPNEPNCENVDCDEYDCGGSLTGLCWDNTNGNICCSDEACCELVCEVDPFCCDEDNPIAYWDDICVAEANLFCLGHVKDGNPNAPDRCNTPLGDSCFHREYAGGTGGCNNHDCCQRVCDLVEFCCTGSWSSYCIALAYQECVDVDASGATPDFTSIQGYRTAADYISQLGDIPVELQGFIPLNAASEPWPGYRGEGWDLFDEDDPHDGLYGFGQLLYDNYGIDATGEGVLTRGKTIKVAVIEWACYDEHEDLDVIVEPEQTMIQEWFTNADHGTACLGIVNAQENGFGVTGIAPDAEAYFFPITSVEEGPRELSAWTSALLTLGPGDVISASYGPGPPVGNLNNDAAEPSMQVLIRLASNLGITVCIAAGNSCYNLDNAPGGEDTGAIVVGGCSPGAPWFRWQLSNFATSGDITVSNVVHVPAWAQAVTTTGYGIAFFPNEDPLRAYTPNFGGTSAAAPQIAGVAACLQGLAKQFYGITLMPEQIRAAIGVHFITGGTRLFGGFGEDSGPGFCWLDVDPDAGPNQVGIYPNPVASAANIVTQEWAGFDDSPLVDDLVVVRGETIYGNVFSVKGRDNNYLVVEAEYTQRGDSPDPPGGGGGGGGGGGSIPEIAEISYLATGNITDVVIVGHADIPGVNSMAMESEMVDPGVFTLVFVEAYDWVAGRWSFVDVVWMNGETEEEGVDDYFVHTASATQRFVRDSDDRILFRMWTLGFSFGGGLGNSGGQSTYRQKLDWVNILVDEDFGEELP
jgi:hypothetical protein